MVQLIVDDRDGIIEYSGSGWQEGGESIEYNTTTMGTNVDGATATIRFTGTQISVYGTISVRNETGSEGLVSTFRIDNEAPLRFQTMAIGSPQYHQRLFQSRPLSSGVLHSLTIRKVGTDQDLWLDYMIIEPSTPINLTTTVASTGVVTRISTIKGPTVTVTSPANGKQQEGLTSSSRTGVLVGSIVGGLALLIVLGIGFFLFCRRSRKTKASNVVLKVPPPNFVRTIISDSNSENSAPMFPSHTISPYIIYPPADGRIHTKS